MSVFGKIMSAIFGSSASAASPASGGTVAQPAAPVTPSAVPLAPAAAPAPAGSQADVAAIMDELAARSDEDLDWRTSIVDLLKLLEVDAARKQLALELHYAGSLSDTAAMNIWLHRKVMAKLAESGGQVPAELRN